MAVQFNEEVSRPARSFARPPSLITRLFMKTGIVKTPAGARVLMLIVLFVALILSWYVFSLTTVTVEPPSAEEVIVE